MIRRTQTDGVTVLQFARPPVNAFDLALYAELLAVLGELAEEPAPLVVVGEGTTFSAGVDLRAILAGDDGHIREYVATMCAAFLALFRYPGPAVAAVNGHAIAGGWIIASACDRRLVAAGDARLGITEVRVGVPFPLPALEIARHAAGARTEDLALSGRLLSPDEALRLGLVDAVVASDALLDQAVASAAELARTDPGVYAFTKRQLRRPAERSIAEGAASDDPFVVEAWCSQSVKASIASFLETTVGASDRPRSRPLT